MQTGRLAGGGGLSGAVGRASQDGMMSVWKGVTFPIVSRIFIKSTLYSTYGWGNSKWQERNKTNRLEWYHYGSSGAFGGCIASVIQTPIDFFKIRLQTTPEHLPLTGRLRYVVKTCFPKEVSPIHVVYRGYTPMVFREVAGFSMYFSIFESLKRKFEFQGKFLPTFVAGSFCGCVSWSLQFPFDVIKSRMQSSPDYTTTARQFVKNAIKEGGVSVLYRGISAALLRACFVHGTSMTTYELILDSLNARLG